LRIEELSDFGVSESIIDKLKELGFETLTSAQAGAIQNGLFDKKSLLISAPTNTGKTFIGELAAYSYLAMHCARNRSCRGKAMHSTPTLTVGLRSI